MHLIVRFYLILVLGLIVLAALFDFGYSLYQDRQRHWLTPEQQFKTIELALLNDAVIDQFTLPVQLLDPQQLPMNSFDHSHLIITESSPNQFIYFYQSQPLQKIIQLGPVTEPKQGTTWLPSLFYLTIIVLAALWFRPLLRDAQRLNNAAQEFAKDYQADVSQLDKVTTLTSLALTLKQMAQQIRQLIQGQKELTSALSHEMRTPLARIKFALAMMPDSPDKTSISHDVEELEQLISQLLNYARLDQTTNQLQLEPVPIAEFLHDVVTRAVINNSKVHWQLEESTNSMIIDQTRFAMAVSNLVVNACRYGNGEILVRFWQDDEQYHLAIEDNGDGIPANERDTVFSAFTRLDNSRNKSSGGYGLGLAIVARIMALHQGSAEISASDSLAGASLLLSWPMQHVTSR